MENTKVLFICQEITPYVPENEMSLIGRHLPQGIQEKGKEIRTFMPRFGVINERRNQLHEVIRLSGMNLIINDTDHPLIIKVASIQAARMQVYFIDNEDYFQRKATVIDEDGTEFDDNDERIIFFARGVLETTKKLRWAPDIVHCQGWFTALAPLMIKSLLSDDPYFANSKIVYTVYDDEYNKAMDKSIVKKLAGLGIDKKELEILNDPTWENLTKSAISMADGIIQGSEKINANIKQFIEKSDKPFLAYHGEEEYIDSYNEFYDSI